jgi:hypothetical protein
LIEQLQNAAYAGRIKFRALKSSEYPADEHEDIDNLYFRQERSFRWVWDQIWSCKQSDYSNDVPGLPNLTEDWHDVHLDREAFVLLLRDMDVSVKQNPDADVQGERKTFRTGAAGRPTSKHLVLKIAQRQLDAWDYPEKLTTFSEQLAAELKATEPEAAPMTAKTVRNVISELWRTHPSRHPK